MIEQPNNLRVYKTTEFSDANDFLNEIYLEISDFVSPGTYGKDWVLIDSITNEALTPEVIEKRIMQEHSGLEMFFVDGEENTEFILKLKD